MPTSFLPAGTVNNARHSLPYCTDTLGICAMFGYECVALAVTVELVLQVPCILFFFSCFNQACAPVASCPILLSNKKCSHNVLASGYGKADKVVSSSFGLPSSLNTVGFQPCISDNLSAMWCLLEGLNVTIFSL